MQSTPSPFTQLDPKQNDDKVQMDQAVQAYWKTLQLPMPTFNGTHLDDAPNKFICAMNIYFEHEYELTGKLATACQKAVMATHTLKGDAKSTWDTSWWNGSELGSLESKLKIWPDFEQWILDNYCVPLKDEKIWENLKLVKLTKAGFNKYLADFYEKWADYSCPISDELLKDMFLTELGKLKLKEHWEIHSNKPTKLSKCIPILQLLENQIRHGEAIQASTVTTIANSTPVDYEDPMELEAIITSPNISKKNFPVWKIDDAKRTTCATLMVARSTILQTVTVRKQVKVQIKEKEAAKPKN